MRSVPLHLSSVVVCAIALLCNSVAASAQSVDGGFDPGANQIVNTIAVQPDGKIVVGGNFTGMGGTTGTTTRNRIARLNADGTLDTFNPGTNGPVLAVAVQPDGKILAGGNFTAVGGGTGLTHSRSRIARFNADGSVDTGFNAGTGGAGTLNVWALAVQPDGKILVGGEFTTLNGEAHSAIGRLNSNGSIDSAFNPNVTKLVGNPIVYTLLVQPDGQILIGGYFNGIGGMTRNFLGRVDTNGAVDSFNPGVTSISGVNALALQANGNIIVGGTYTQLAGSNRANIGRINSAGVLDLSFNPGTETTVLTLGVQTDGKILAGGYFKWMGDAGGSLKSTRNYIGRLNSNGTVDGSFDPGANNVVNAVALQADGAIVAGGIFDHLGNGGSLLPGAGILRNRIGRITNTDAGVQSLTLSSGDTVVTWERSGGGPEVSLVTFELSAAGGPYSLLGNGTRVVGGWTLSGLALPDTRNRLRARGYYQTGQNGFGSIAESIYGSPATSNDFDGDGLSDRVVFRPSSGTWYTLQSSDSAVAAVQFGLSGDVPVSGDYDADGKTDIAVYRPSSGTWYIQQGSSYVSLQFGLPGDAPVPADYDGDTKTDIAVYRSSDGTWYIRQSTTSTVATVVAGAAGDVPVPADYDADGQADVALYRPPTGEWLIRRSSSPSPFMNVQFGLNGDVPVPGRYDGDRMADIAIYRPTTGTWYILESTTNNTTYVQFQWGLPGDIAEPGDYDGDRKADIAVYRPSNGTWYVRLSTTNYSTSVTTQFGLPGDTAVPGAVMANAIARVKPVAPLANLVPFNDFDGDRKADLTVFRPSTGTWYTLRSSANYTTSTSTQFGLPGDLPVPGDFDGDSKADIAIFRSGTWYILKSSDSTFSAQQWGLSGDIPVPGDYDGDGKTDIAVFRSGTWYILKSLGSTFVSYAWGLSGDQPVPGDYDGDGISDLAVFRPSTGTWFILKSSGNFGTSMQYQWGLSGDIAVPGDFDGDGKTDLSVYRPSSGTWYVSQNSSGSPTTLIKQFGLTGDISVAGDYDGDGKTDIAVFRPPTGTWFHLLSGSNYTSSASYQFGLSGDIPILKRP
jgi:uncharacterized delta-60 repeat protein